MTTQRLLTEPVAAALSGPGSIRTSSLLMQDMVSAKFLKLAAPTEAGNLAGRTALFANPFREGKEEALVVSDEGKLTYLERSGTETGWTRTPVAAAAGVRVAEVAVIVHPRDLVIIALYSPETGPPQTLQLVATTTEGVTTCSWKALPDGISYYSAKPGSLSRLFVSYDARSPVICGFDRTTGNAVSLRSMLAPGPRLYCEPPLPMGIGRVNQLVGGRLSGQADIFFARLGSELLRFEFSGNGRVAQDAAWLAGVYRSNTRPDLGVVYLDTSGNLVVASRPDAVSNGYVYSKTPGLGFVTATAWLDVNQMLHVYGLDEANTLKVVHQVSWAARGVPVWSSARPAVNPPPPPRSHGAHAEPAPREDDAFPACVGLVPRVSAFAVDPFPDYQPGQFVQLEGETDAGNQYGFFAQDINSARWTRDMVRLPEGPPNVVTHYVSTVSILDRRGNPMPGTTVKISAETPAEVRIEGASYLVGPGRSAQIPANALGRVVLSAPATSLLPATLHADVVGLADGAIIQAAGAVHEYLSGVGTLPSRQGRFDATALAGATVDGKPIVPADKQHSVPDVVHGVTQTFQLATGTAALVSRLHTGAGPARVLRGFCLGEVPGGHPDGPGRTVYREFYEDGDELTLEAHLQQIRDLPEYAGIWEDLAAWAGDVWAGIANGVIEVYNTVVAVADAVARVFIKIGEKIVELVGFVVDTVEAAVDLVHSAFARVVEAVTAVVDWLKALFAFDDIWDTKTALEAYTGVLFGNTTAAIDHAAKKTGGWFDAQKAAVQDAVKKMEREYTGRPVGDVTNQLPVITDPGGAPLATAELRENPQANWMAHQPFSLEAVRHHDGLLQIDRSVVDPIADAYSLFLEQFTHNGLLDRLTEAWGDLVDLVSGVSDPNDPDQAAKSSANGLLALGGKVAVKVLDGLDALLQDALTMVRELVSAIPALLDEEINLGPVNAVYEWFRSQTTNGGSEAGGLTLRRLGALIAAFASTTVYKLINGVDRAPFPGGYLPILQPPNSGLDADGKEKWPPYDAQACKTAQIVFGSCGLVGGIFDLMSDTILLFSSQDSLVLSFCSNILSSTMYGAALNFPSTQDPLGERDGGWYGVWAFQAISCVFGWGAWGTALRERIDGEPAQSHLRNAGDASIGPVITFILQMGSVICGEIAAAADEAQPWVRAQVALPGISGLGQLLRMPLSLPTRPRSNLAIGSAIVGSGIDVLATWTGAAMTVAAATFPGPEINSPDELPAGRVNGSYEYQLTATGGDKPFNEPLRWNCQDLAPGLKLSEDGKLTGAPTQSGTFWMNLVCADSFSPPCLTRLTASLTVS